MFSQRFFSTNSNYQIISNEAPITLKVSSTHQ